MSQTPAQPSSGKLRRATRQVETSSFLDARREHHGLEKIDLAAATSAEASHVGQWCDPEADRNLAVADARALPAPLRLDIAEHIAGPGHAVVALPAASAPLDDMRAIARLAAGHGTTVGGLLAAIADGTIDPQEARAMLPQVREHVRELMGVVIGLEAAEKLGRPVARLRGVGA